MSEKTLDNLVGGKETIKILDKEVAKNRKLFKVVRLLKEYFTPVDIILVIRAIKEAKLK